MEGLTFAQVISAIAVILVLLGAYNTVMTAVKNHREEKKLKDGPVKAMQDKIDAHDKMLKNDKERLDELEPAVNLLLKTNLAMLQHMVYGNSDDKMKELVGEIQTYLINRK